MRSLDQSLLIAMKIELVLESLCGVSGSGARLLHFHGFSLLAEPQAFRYQKATTSAPLLLLPTLAQYSPTYL